ncbi:uncharacterized protein MP3633_0190 [Marinomonas primoryensis]|uniref:Uncharacterized protein n=1 Tax=Marinomonas primoryensis TaxID=178399 RepID=A0A859CS00_9GAMM|nr:uncharacterized protein MP3633_0190 [Marinomonas primoryensis]
MGIVKESLLLAQSMESMCIPRNLVVFMGSIANYVISKTT